MIDTFEERARRLQELYTLQLETLGLDKTIGGGNRTVHETMGSVEATNALLAETTDDFANRVVTLLKEYENELKSLGGDVVRGNGNRSVHEAMGKIDAIKEVTNERDITQAKVHAVFYRQTAKPPWTLRIMTLGLYTKLMDSVHPPLQLRFGERDEEFIKEPHIIIRLLFGDIRNVLDSEMDGTPAEVYRLFLQMRRRRM